VITLDSSGLYALLDRLDADHARAVESLLADPGPYLVPVAILSEIGYVVERRLGTDALVTFLDDVASGGFALDCGEADLARIRALVSKYRDLPLGFADAAVIACAERCGGLVLTLDVRHFGVVAREGRIQTLPA
jgi:predicted nucleic acid-binding protein